MFTVIKPSLYQDMAKRPSDLLAKDFPLTNKFTLNTKTTNGVAIEATLNRNPDDSIVGSVNPRYTDVRTGVTVGATVDTHHTLKLEAEASQLFPGFTAKIIGDTKSDSVTLEGRYLHDFFTLNGSVDFFNPKGTNALAAATVGYEGFTVGLQTRYANNGLAALNGCATYGTPDFLLSVLAMFKNNRVQASYFQRVNRLAAVGVEASFDLADTMAESPKFTVGGRYELDPLSASFTKAKLDTDGRLSLSFGQRLNPYASATVGALFNTNNFSKAGGHAFGFTLALND